MTTTVPSINQAKLEQFMGKVLSDFGGAASAILTYIGDKLGLYKAMYEFGKPISSQSLQILIEQCRSAMVQVFP